MTVIVSEPKHCEVGGRCQPDSQLTQLSLGQTLWGGGGRGFPAAHTPGMPAPPPQPEPEEPVSLRGVK